MAFVDIQAQLSQITSLCSQMVERVQMQNVSTFGGQDHSNFMWQAPQQAQDNAYWQPHEEYYQQPHQEPYWQPYDDFHAPPQLPLQSSPNNSGSLIDHNAILQDLLASLTQGKETQQVQQETYWQPYEESYAKPYEEFYAPSQPLAQPAQTNLGSSIDNDQIFQVLTSMAQDMQTRDKKVDELEKHVGQIADFMKQLVEDEPQASNPSQNMDELLQQEEEEEDIGTAREEPRLPQPPQVLPPPTSCKVVPISDLVPPNVPFPRRFLQSTKDEGKQDILATFPKIQEEDVVEEHLELIKEGIGVDHTANDLKTPNLAKSIPSEVVDGAATFEPILQPLGKPPTPIPIPISNNMLLPTLVQAPNPIQVGGSVYKDLRTDLFPLPYKDPMLESFEEPVMENVLEFLLPHIGKPLPKFSSSFYANMLLSSMIQAPTLEFKPLPGHFKYHLPFSDALPAIGLIQA